MGKVAGRIQAVDTYTGSVYVMVEQGAGRHTAERRPASLVDVDRLLNEWRPAVDWQERGYYGFDIDAEDAPTWSDVMVDDHGF